MGTNSSENLPVMLYVHGYIPNNMDSVAQALQQQFGDRYRVVICTLDLEINKSLSRLNKLIAQENPQIILGWGIDGYIAMLSNWDEKVSVIVVNPFIDNGLDKLPLWKYQNIFALCSKRDELYGESYISTLKIDYPNMRLIETSVFGHKLNNTGIKQLCHLINKIDCYRKLEKNLMTYKEFEEMVRNRPAPDTPSYYSLKVYNYDTKDDYSREIVNNVPTYRRSVSHRQAQFATEDEAIAAMQSFIASAKEDICMFELERLPFGVFDSRPFWLEMWSYDSRGNLIHESSCSGSHYLKAGIFGKFFGHLPEKIKWCGGDIVQLFHHYFGDSKTYVCLGIVAEAPKDTREGYDKYIYAVKQWIKDGNNPKDWLEMTGYEGSDDDEMFTQFGPYNEDWSNFTFNSPMIVLPAPENLSEEIESELHAWHADWLRHLEKERSKEIRVTNQMCEYEKKKNE